MSRWIPTGLSIRLLGLTLVFVLVAEVLIYFPSAANYRNNWLQDRVQAARLAALGVEAAPDFRVSDELATRLLAEAEVEAVAISRKNARILILRPSHATDNVLTLDVRTETFLTAIVEVVDHLMSPPERHLRILADGIRPGDELDVIVEETPLRRELWAYSGRIAVASLFISLITASLVYATLILTVVRPVRRLSNAMVAFREAPENPDAGVKPTERRDEIGQAEREFADMQTQVRQALHQKARLAALGEAVAKINHDLRNILASAQLTSDGLAQSKDARTRAGAARLVRAVDRVVNLCEEVLKYGRAEESPPARIVFALAPALDEAAEDAIAQSGDVLWRNDTPPDFKLFADPDHAHRIFLNLMRNAIQAMRASGSDRAPRLHVEACQTGPWIDVCVCDNGPGVPKKAQERLFAAFSGSTTRGGTGLGLAISLELARAHGGRLALKRTGPEGTAFEVRLPAAT
ncbi:MAG: sensor histidine kinase [Maricaulaceae bacterium]